MLAKAMGANKLIGVDVVEECLEVTQKLGLADHLLKAGTGNAEEIRRLTGGYRVERAVLWRSKGKLRLQHREPVAKAGLSVCRWIGLRQHLSLLNHSIAQSLNCSTLIDLLRDGPSLKPLAVNHPSSRGGGQALQRGARSFRIGERVGERKEESKDIAVRTVRLNHYPTAGTVGSALAGRKTNEYGTSMTTVAEIESAIEHLPIEQVRELVVSPISLDQKFRCAVGLALMRG